MIKIGDRINDSEFDVYHKDDFYRLRFSSLVGRWVVLMFYPADFTFVCPTELEEAAEFYDEFQKQGAEIISFSTDTKYTHKAWHDASPAIQKIKFPMAADPAGKICRDFGTYNDEEGLSVRATIIISREGFVKAMEYHDNSIGRSMAEILRKLEAAKYVSEHDGEVCPANWSPGKKTLKPDVSLVGKI